MTYREALRRSECAQEQAEECRRNWLTAKTPRNTVLYAEAANLAAESQELLNQVVNEENLAAIREEARTGLAYDGDVKWDTAG